MAERLHPGVYVEEISSGIRPIEGVSTSTAAFLGLSARGIPGLPTLVTSFEDYRKSFGGHLPKERGFLGMAAAGFFDAGGRRAYVVRVMPASALAARQELPQPTRFAPATGEAAPALLFRAKGKGRWADNIRIEVSNGTNFPAETFRVEVAWSEAGSTRTLEVFDDLRMDPDSEDYFVQIINERSRYLQVADEFARVNDEDNSDIVPVPELVPRLSAVSIPATGRYTVHEGVALDLAWTGGPGPEPRTASVIFRGAGLPFVDGVASLSRGEMGTFLTTQLAGSAFRVVREGMTQGRIAISAPAAGTVNLTGETLNVTIGGSVTNIAMAGPAVPTPAAVTRDQLLAALTNRLAPNNQVAVEGDRIVIRTQPVLAGGAPVFSQTPGVRALAVDPIVPGAAATPGRITIDVPGGGNFNLDGETLRITIGATATDFVVADEVADDANVSAAALAAALDARLGAGINASVVNNQIVIEADAVVGGVAMALSQSPNARPLTFTATAGNAATAGRIAIAAPAAGTQDLSGETLDFTIGGVATSIAVAGNVPNPASVTPGQLATLLGQRLAPGNTVQEQGNEIIIQTRTDPAGVPVVFGQTPGTRNLTASVTPGSSASRISIEPAIATRGRIAIATPAGAPLNLSGKTLTVTVGGTATDIVLANEVADPTAVGPAELAAVLGDRLGADNAVEIVGDAIVIRTQPIAEGTAPVFAQTAGAAGAAQLVATATAGVPGTVVESLDGITITVGEAPNRHFPRTLNSLGFPSKARGYEQNAPANPLVRPRNTTDPIRLVGGFDGNGDPAESDYEDGLRSLDRTEINLVAIPGQNAAGILSRGLTYCDRRGDCFFLADGPGHIDDDLEVGPTDAKGFIEGLPNRSMNAAMFYPWIQLPDPVGAGRNPKRYVPPSGHVAGIFARTDISRGVWKAPAGLEATVSNAIGLQYDLIDAEQDLLNPVSLNCIRRFPGAGIVSWGSRTLSSDPEWRYVPVRRTALFLKESLRRGLQWAVFEPNDQELWDRIRINIDSFMLSLFRQGAFQGATPDEAFTVVCDRSTNPQDLVDQGIVTARVAFAPLKPAEFVVIQISQKTLVGT
jgi:phage tail sheath protein FI